jgi:hypothetical protein
MTLKQLPIPRSTRLIFLMPRQPLQIQCLNEEDVFDSILLELGFDPEDQEFLTGTVMKDQLVDVILSLVSAMSPRNKAKFFLTYEKVFFLTSHFLFFSLLFSSFLFFSLLFSSFLFFSLLFSSFLFFSLLSLLFLIEFSQRRSYLFLKSNMEILRILQQQN